MNKKSEFASISLKKDEIDPSDENQRISSGKSLGFIFFFLISACFFAFYCFKKDAEEKKRKTFASMVRKSTQILEETENGLEGGRDENISVSSCVNTNDKNNINDSVDNEIRENLILK